MLTKLANILTLSRIAVIPLVVGLFYVETNWSCWAAFGLYAAACVTDYMDGYVARNWAQESAIGRFLDPIADKLLVSAVLVLLVAFQHISGAAVLPAIVILLREVAVSGLREFLAQANVGVPVSRLAKWKTGIQMLALGFLIVGDEAGPRWLPTTSIGIVGLWLAGVLTLITGWDYFRAGLKHMLPPEQATAPPAKAPPRRAKAAG
jgi:cardiolipin synthase